MNAVLQKYVPVTSSGTVLGKYFKPSPRYGSYLAISVILLIALVWTAGAVWIFYFSDTVLVFAAYAAYAAPALCLLVTCLILGSAWVTFYVNSIVYALNSTEMIWKRGFILRRFGIVSYNHITSVDIVQGPVMRLFGISSLRLRTAGGSGRTNVEISLEGVRQPETVRTLIMDFVRGAATAALATGADADTASAPSPAGIPVLLAKVTAIRTTPKIREQ